MPLSKRKIKKNISSLSVKVPVITYKTTDSTNTRAKFLAECGKYVNAAFIASEQTAGRGRLGRSFISEGGKGLYLSILIGGPLPADFAVSLTTYMAVVASNAIDTLAGIETQIKWVNDIYASGRKLAGILTEGKAAGDGKALEYAVVGIGINLLKQSFNEEVSRIATTLEDESGKEIDINSLAGLIIKNFFENLELVGTPAIANEYKTRSFLIGENVTVIKPTKSYEAHVDGITDKCELMLTLKDGGKEVLSTGEVSVRKTVS